jgi:hypothetical protein
MNRVQLPLDRAAAAIYDGLMATDDRGTRWSMISTALHCSKTHYEGAYRMKGTW